IAFRNHIALRARAELEEPKFLRRTRTMKMSKWMTCLLLVGGAQLGGCGAGEPGSDAATADASEERLNATRTLTAVHSGRCMDVKDFSTADGGLVQQWDCSGNANQQWQFKDMGNGQHEIINVNSGKCLDVSGVSKSNGAVVHQWRCHGKANQLWTLSNK